MGFRSQRGVLEPFVAILSKFKQRFAFGGNSRNPNLGVFQQNKPKAEVAFLHFGRETVIRY
jgi:hypothetical protein